MKNLNHEILRIIVTLIQFFAGCEERIIVTFFYCNHVPIFGTLELRITISKILTFAIEMPLYTRAFAAIIVSRLRLYV